MGIVIQLAGATPSRLRPRLHGPEARLTMHSLRPSPQRDANSSVLLGEELRSQGLAAEKTTSHLSPLLDEERRFLFHLVCLFGGLVITGITLSPFIYSSFFSLH
jgi:hypothetical protein